MPLVGCSGLLDGWPANDIQRNRGHDVTAHDLSNLFAEPQKGRRLCLEVRLQAISPFSIQDLPKHRANANMSASIRGNNSIRTSSFVPHPLINATWDGSPLANDAPLSRKAARSVSLNTQAEAP